jgi:hypothetical protein
MAIGYFAGFASSTWGFHMMRRMVAILAIVASSLFAATSAYGHDCIRVSSSHQGLISSTSHGGRWLLFDFSSVSATTQTLQRIEVPATAAQIACFVPAYAATGQPQFFALGIGVAGPNGVLAHNNPNDRVLGDGHGIDHFDDSPIVSAIIASAGGCGIPVS